MVRLGAYMKVQMLYYFLYGTDLWTWVSLGILELIPNRYCWTDVHTDLCITMINFRNFIAPKRNPVP